ncbi:MAG: NADH-quinone oxidoreductase subunit M [Planctomycetota bacterium]
MSLILPLLVLLPLVFAGVLRLPMHNWHCRKTTWIASLVVAGVTGLLALILAVAFPWSDPGVQFRGVIPWFPALGLSFSYGLDAVALWLVLITAVVLMPVVVLAAWGEKLASGSEEKTGELAAFLSWIFVLEAALLGVFVAQDAILFYACFELTLLPAVFLIARFGGPERVRAAMTYFFFAFTGSVFTLAGLLYVGWRTSQIPGGGGWAFEFDALYFAAAEMSATEQGWVFAALLAGFLVKMPMFPLHTWLPGAHEQAPAAGSVDVAALVLKIAPFGILKLAIPLAPLAAVQFAPVIGALACVGVVYAALCAWVQRDAKKLIAYSSISHMGFCLLGLFAFDESGIGASGAIFYMLAHAFAAAGLLLCVGIVHDRFGTRDLTRLGGLAAVAPGLAFFVVLFAMTSVGLPGLNGFVGEFLTMMGTFNSPTGVLGPAYAAVAATGVVLAALYLLHLTARVVWGAPGSALAGLEQSEPGTCATRGKLDRREFSMLAPLALGCVLLGVFPQLILGPIEQPVAGYVADAAGVANDRADQLAKQDEPQRRGERGEELLSLDAGHDSQQSLFLRASAVPTAPAGGPN